MKIQNPLIKGKVTYYADTGVDIYPENGASGKVIAPLGGTIIYSEGLKIGDDTHTAWVYSPDTPGCILLELDKPLTVNKKEYYYFWFCHLQSLVYHVRDGIDKTIKIPAGTFLGYSGLGNKVAHLHFGILSNRAQKEGDYMQPAEIAKLITDEELVADTSTVIPKTPAPPADADRLKIFTHPGKNGLVTKVLFKGKELNDVYINMEIAIKEDKNE